MLEIRRKPFSKSYENLFFREISRSLAENFKLKGINWLLIGSPECSVDEAFKPDAILITERALLLLEFKNYGGQIQLPDAGSFEIEPWKINNWESVYSGNSANPYLQLRKQEKRFAKILNEYVIPKLWDGEKINPNRIVWIVCFQEDVKLLWKVPEQLQLSFFIKPNSEIIAGILDVVDIQKAGTSIKTESFRHFVNIFPSPKFDPNSEKHDGWIEEMRNFVNIDELKEDQVTALDKIRRFISSEKETAFILKGSSGSGKTQLIPFIQEIAIKHGCSEVVVLGLNRSVCKNLIARPWIEGLDSIYSHIYGGTEPEKTSESAWDGMSEVAEKDDGAIDVAEEIKIVPIKANEDSEKTLYVIDEAHSVNENTGSPQGVLFWTGRLLSDFLQYSKGKKVVFIGDPYLLQHGKNADSCLSEKHLLDVHGINVASFELHDKDRDSTLLKNALKCVRCIRSGQYNDLNFDFDEDFVPLHRGEFLELANHWDDKDRVILKYTNDEVSKVNAYFKNSVCLTGEKVGIGDLVFFDASTKAHIVEWTIESGNEERKIHKWEFATILEISDDEWHFSLEEQDFVIGSTTLSLQGNSKKIRVNFLKNYLDSEEIRSDVDLWKKLMILKSLEMKKALRANPFHQSAEFHNLRGKWVNKEEIEILDEYARILDSGWGKKARNVLKKKLSKEWEKKVISTKKKYELRIRHELEKDENSAYSKISDAALLRYGWALTVHKARMRKWPEVILDGDVWGMGKDTESYCRWLYTGLTRSSGTLRIANFKPNHPLMSANFVNASSSKKLALPYFSSQKPDIQERIRDFVAHIERKLASTSYRVRQLPKKAEQYRVFLECGDLEGHTFEIAAYFNANGDFRLPDFVSKDIADSERAFMESITKPEWDLFSGLPNSWRKRMYEDLVRTLWFESFVLTHLLQHAYKDVLAFERQGKQSVVEFNYWSNGFYSNIKLTNCENPSDWALIKEAITSLRP